MIQRFKYPFFAVINILVSILMLLRLSGQKTISISSLLSVALLFILGATGIYYLIINRHTDASEEPEKLKSWYDLIKFVDILLIIAVLIRSFVFQPYIVDGHSMEPTFHGSEFVLVDRLSYRLHKPNRGDIIVFHPNISSDENLSYIKRIIGLPGEKITIKDGSVFINNHIVDEPYIKGVQTTTENNLTTSLERTLSSDEYFVMGDNRANSSDSRIIGPVKFSSFIGRAYITLFPANEIGIVSHDNTSLSSQQILNPNF